MRKKPIEYFVKSVLLLAVLGLQGWKGWAQEQTLDTLVQRFNRYGSHALQEKVFLHTDRSFYMSGEVMWFKAYLVDGLLHQPLAISKVAYVEVLDTAQTPVLQGNIALDAGKGNGSFYLPVGMHSGHYTVRAYTSWMKNFDPDFYFQQPITVVNPFTHLGLQASDTSNQYDVQFFPEGGNLVADIESKVAFKATGIDGKGIDFTGMIINQQQDTIVRFQPFKFCMGNFSFTPEAGKQYKAIIEKNDSSFIYNLPAIYPRGYVMHVAETGQNQLSVTVRAKGENADPVYLLVHTRQSLKIAAMLPLQNGKVTFQIDKQELGSGISHFTVFNSQLQAVCERLYFRQPTHSLHIEASVDQPLYSTREQATVQLQTNIDSENPIPANLSMAIYRIDSLTSFEQPDLLSYMWLTSDLKGRIESPAYYFSENKPEIAEATDNLMLTQGWRRFKWDQVLQTEVPAYHFLPEYEGAIIKARVLDKTSKEPAFNIPVYLTVPGKYFQFYSAKSFRNGEAEFITKNMIGATALYFHTNTSIDSTHTVALISPFSNQHTITALPAFDLSENTRHQLQQRSMSMQVQHIFAEKKMNQFAKAVIDTMPFFGLPDKTYLLDAYTRFPTMEEVMREYVQEVAVRKQRNQYQYKIMDEEAHAFYDEDPLVLLDGLPIFDMNKAIALDPLKIKRLDVVQQKFILNKTVFTGIVSYTTYHGDLSWFQPDPYAIKIAYEGLQQQREFYSPRYDTEKQITSRVPDFRVLLHWSPDINTDQTGRSQVSFYTSDQQGKYIGIIQGMSDTGAMGSSSFTFTVKAEPAN